MKLSEWATMIRAPWFNAMLHDLALTDNGRWGKFGLEYKDYDSGSLTKRIENAWNTSLSGSPIEITRYIDAQTGMQHISARGSDELRNILRTSMRSHTSPGCPVAFHAGAIPAHFQKDNPHFERLITHGDIQVEPSPRHPETLLYTQPQTPIDKATRVFADLLEAYEANFGTPYVRQDKQNPGHYVISHEGRPTANRIQRIFGGWTELMHQLLTGNDQ